MREEDHPHAEHIDRVLSAFVTSMALVSLLFEFCCMLETNCYLHPSCVKDDNAAYASFKACFEGFVDIQNQDQLRYTLAKRLCVPIIHNMSATNQTKVFVEIIPTLMGIIPLEDKAAASQASSSQRSQKSQMEEDDEDKKTRMVQALCAFGLIEALYQCLPAEIIKKSINKAYCMAKAGEKQMKEQDIKGNELTSDIMRAAHAINSKKSAQANNNNKKDTNNNIAGSVMDVDIEEEGQQQLEQQLQQQQHQGRGITPKLLLEYHQTTYNALTSVIRTQTKENFFNVFLFKETWDNIIDLNEKHTFQVETNYALARQIVTALSSKNLAALQPIKVEGGTASTASSSSSAAPARGNLRMMSSQFLADSSLGQELTYMGSFFGNK